MGDGVQEHAQGGFGAVAIVIGARATKGVVDELPVSVDEEIVAPATFQRLRSETARERARDLRPDHMLDRAEIVGDAAHQVGAREQVHIDRYQRCGREIERVRAIAAVEDVVACVIKNVVGK